MSKARAAIDRRYFLGDVLIKAGGALAAFTIALGVIFPLNASAFSHAGAIGYGTVLALSLVGAGGLAIQGRRLRRSAARLDRG